MIKNLVLYKIKDIVFKKIQRDYYKMRNNIKEILTLNAHYYSVENISLFKEDRVIFWKNVFYSFRNISQSLHNISWTYKKVKE